LAAIDALSPKSDEYLKELRIIYLKRAQYFVKLFKEELNWKIPMPKASMFLWGKIPDHLFDKTKTTSCFGFCKELILKSGVVFAAGSSFGSNGEGYVRISLIHDKEGMINAVSKIKNLVS
jgi:aspartate/methionine/tyrosine aminotransferase